MATTLKKKGFISEGDVALLLRRYNANTLLALLQEVAKSSSTKLDWNALVKNSNTGIKNEREYQALWRHLAYRINIADCFEDDSQPVEEDSDLEFEVEPLPGVSPEIATQVAACVKVLATPGTSGGPLSKGSALETSFAIDIPNSASGWDVKGNGQISGSAPFAHTSNVVQNPAAGSVGEQPPRKKRKFWTAEEDRELIAAVEKCGEGNWATILKGGFKHDRTASQLSQRWALIRKRREGQANVVQTNLPLAQVNNTGGNQAVVASSSPLPLVTAEEVQTPTPPVAASSTSVVAAISNNVSTSAAVSSTPAVQLPTLDQSFIRTTLTTKTVTLPPSGKSRPLMKKSGLSCSQPTGGRRIMIPGVATSSAVAQAISIKGSEILQTKMMPPTTSSLSLLSPATAASGRFTVSSGLRNNSVSSLGRGNLKTSTGPDPMVQAAAVAAGARIAPASAAASLLKAAQSGNVVHIGPGGLSMGKSGLSNQASNNPVTSAMRMGTGVTGSRNSGGAVVHYIRTGTGAPTSSFLLNGMRPSQLQSKTNISRTAQTNHLMRTSTMAAPIQISSSQAPLTSGPLLPSSQVQKGISAIVPMGKSRPKSQIGSLAGDSCSTAVSDSVGEPATLESSPSLEIISSALLPTPTALTNVIEHASTEQSADPAVGSLCSSRNGCEVALELLPPNTVVDTCVPLVSTIAHAADCINSSSLLMSKDPPTNEGESNNNCVAATTMLPAPQTQSLQQSESCATVSIADTPMKGAINIEGQTDLKTPESPEVGTVSPADSLDPQILYVDGANPPAG